MFAEKNIWLAQKKMAELFSCSPDNISLHLKNLYSEKEVDESATAEDFSVVQKEGAKQGDDDEGLDYKTKRFFEI